MYVKKNMYIYKGAGIKIIFFRSESYDFNTVQCLVYTGVHF